MTATAVTQYMLIRGATDSADRQDRHAAALRLRAIIELAEFDRPYERGGLVCEAWVGADVIAGEAVRLGLGVSTARRREGDLPQLVAVVRGDAWR